MSFFHYARRVVLFIALFSMGSTVTWAADECSRSEYVTAGQVVDKEGLKQFVTLAKLHMKKGLAPISDFREDGIWNSNGVYIFILNTNGDLMFHGNNAGLEGKNVWSLTDANGAQIVQDIIKVGLAGGGFVSYLWDNPTQMGDEMVGSTKISYITTYLGREENSMGEVMFIGAGFHPGAL